MKVLVTGASGFIGRALVARLIGEGFEVDAWDRGGGPSAPALRRQRVDLLSSEPLPDPGPIPWGAAFHLAAHTVPGGAWSFKPVIENLSMTARLVEHLALHAPGCRTIVASSAHVYAPSPAALNEEAPVGPARPYGLSKQLCEDWVVSARQRLHVHIVRGFNQIGPNMSKGLLIPDVLERLAQKGSQAVPLSMKGRDDWKDFLDWRDAVDAYMLLLHVDAPSGSVWNLCSGRRTRVSSLIRTILTECKVEREIQFSDPGVEALLGDPSKLMRATGWAPRRDLNETVKAICNFESDSPTP